MNVSSCSPNIIFSRTSKSALKVTDRINSLYGDDMSLLRLIVSRKAALNGFFSSDKPKGYISEAIAESCSMSSS